MRKRRNKKQLVALLLAGVMCITVFLNGCGNSAFQESTGSDNESSVNVSQGGETEKSNQESTTSAEDNKLVIAIQNHVDVSDYEDNYLTHYLEDLLEIDLEFYLLPTDGDEVNTKISLMATSGEGLPDALITTSLYSAAIYNYGQNGLFAPLNEYINDASAMPNYNSMPEDIKALMTESSTQADGNIYSIAKYLPANWNLATFRCYINEAWLEKLELEMPETTEQLKDVLIAFRDKDPNGNGIKDEIPLYGRTATGKSGDNILTYLMNAFTFWNGNVTNGGLALNEEGTQVIAPFVSDEWKEGLLYMKELYDEGLLFPSVFTDDSTQFKATLNAETNVVGCVLCTNYGNWSDFDNNPNYKEMTMLAPLTGPEGVSWAAYSEYEPSQRYFIFNGSDKIDLAIKLADAFFDRDIDLISRYGEENVDWTRDPKILSTLKNWRTESGIYDGILVGIYRSLYESPMSVIWRDLNPGYRSAEIIGCATDINATEYDPTLAGNKDMMFHHYNYLSAHPEYILKELKYSNDEMITIQDIVTTIPSYIMQTMAEFITGIRDIESGWDAYLSELEGMGLNTWLECAQDAYERTLK